jgi:hypothetical protein
MTNFREIYFKAKSGKLSRDEMGSVQTAVFAGGSSVPYHAILSFGLGGSPSDKNLKRVIELANEYFMENEDDLLKACLTTGCIYWDCSRSFCDLSKKIIDTEDLGLFQDSAIVAATCISKVAHNTKSKELLTYLVDHAKISLDAGEPIRGEALINAALKAATGEKRIAGAQTKAFFATSELDNIQFGMTLSPS